MKQTLHFLYDIDGVLADSCKVVLDHFNQEFNEDYTIEDVANYTFLQDEVTQRANIGPEEAFYFLYAPEIMGKSNTMPLSQQLSSRLAAMGHRQSIVTSRPSEQKTTTIKWLMKSFDWVQPELVHVSPNTPQPGHADAWKLKIIKDLKPDYYFEDSAKTVEYILTDKPKTTAVKLIDQPWNRSYTHLDKYRTNWVELEQVLF